MVEAVFRKKGDEAVTKEWEGITFSFDESDRETISSNPMLRDPYESERVFVKTSTIPDAGDGLFAKRKLKAGEVVSFYNGIRLTHAEVDERDWALNSNTISIDEVSFSNK